MRKWDKKDVARVVKSWRRMDEDECEADCEVVDPAGKGQMR